MTRTLLIVLLFCFGISAMAQQKSTSPYQWQWKRDGLWTGAALGTSYYGLTLIRNKDDLTQAELQSIVDD